MRFDLLTLYFLAIGTLLLSAALTLWECQTRPRRTREMCILATGYCALALGCAFATCRAQWPGALGAALSNLAMLSGYSLILAGIATFAQRSHRFAIAALLAACTAAWALIGGRWQDQLWNYASALPIAVVSAGAAWETLRNPQLRALRAHRIVAALTAAHAVFYLGRGVLLPVLAMRFGSDLVAIAGKITMYEGVLYSVGLPMALLSLIREEADQQLIAESCTDYLTGLGNRRWFFEQGERLLGASEHRQAPAALLAFDLDHFKAINDRHGHATGDQVLRSFAQIARSAVGPEAIVARLGGEEFVAVLPHCDRLQAQAVAAAVATRFAATVAHDPQGTPVNATVSIGLAEFGRHGTALSEVLSAADQGLYLAKSRGRNRLEHAPVPLPKAA